MDETIFTGSCLCGQVIFELSPPFVFFHHCHCSRCRKSSGSAYRANILVKARQFRWTRGEGLVRRWELPAAEHYCTGWCSNCGSSLPWRSRNGKGYLVPAGALDEDPGSRPDKNLHWASRASWFVEPGGLPSHDEVKE